MSQLTGTMGTGLGWHFTNGFTLRDGTPLEIGRTYHVDPPLVMCKRGLHLSERALDALYYAPGSVVSRVRYGGAFIRGYDKIVCSERTVIACSDTEQVLRAFARWCALLVAHLWNMPSVVRRYLETGDESLRAAAGAAARAAAGEAAWAAARNAARAAAWAAARAAAGEAAWAAAGEAAWAAAGEAAGEAAWEAARAAQNKELEKRLNELLGIA